MINNVFDAINVNQDIGADEYEFYIDTFEFFAYLNGYFKIWDKK